MGTGAIPGRIPGGGGVDVSEDDTLVVSGVSDINFSTLMGVADDGDGTVTVSNDGEPQTSVETVDMGGSNGSISPTDRNVNPLLVLVDAGGSAANLEGIDGVATQGQVVIIQHTGGENITLEHNNGGATNPLLTLSETDETLDANEEVAAFAYDGTSWRMVWSNVT